MTAQLFRLDTFKYSAACAMHGMLLGRVSCTPACEGLIVVGLQLPLFGTKIRGLHLHSQVFTLVSVAGGVLR